MLVYETGITGDQARLVKSGICGGFQKSDQGIKRL